jgi:poly-gamma-glutamate capsule biosynthesis protein CapA/YwtB (metallophosphatase superfamily)
MPTHPGLTIAAVGDIMMGTDFPENILPDDDGVGFLAAVTQILSQPDVTFGNLEGVLQDGGEPVKQCKDKRICFLFRTPTRYATYLAQAGFDVMSLANNHARDFGEEGRSASMAALDSVGIRHSGREGTVASWVANGRRVAMVAFAPNVGANSLNDPQIGLPQVAELAASHDIVIVSFHGGAEGNGAEVLPFAREIFAGEDRGNVVEFARAMVDAGADLVLGHGPHVVRPMEVYRDRLIAYSLGNFATYYGISVEGIRGIAPILLCTLDDEGRFVSGRVEATAQIRPAGPTPDAAGAVITLLRSLTDTAFPQGQLQINADGTLSIRALTP